MTWSRLDPGAGDPSAIRAMAAVRSDEVDELTRRVAADIQSAESMGELWMGSAASEFNTRLGAVRGKIRELARGYDQQADALLDYASEVEHIARAASNIRARASANAEELRVLRIRLTAAENDPTQAILAQQLEAKIHAAQTEDRGIEQEWDALTVRRSEADRVCASEVSGGSGGSSSDYGSAYTADGLYTDDEFLTVLTGMTAAQITALLASDPSFGARLAAVQDAEAVASWWQSLAPAVENGQVPVPSEEQLALLMAAPAVFGNLNGIWYGHRDLANREAFDTHYDQLIALNQQVQSLSSMTEMVELLYEHGYDPPGVFAAELAEAQAIQATLDREDTFSDGAPPYQFILYVPGEPTLAAVSVGDMDTASQVTTNVPGMGSTVTDSLEEWTMTAENLYYEQNAMNQHYGTGETGFASVAWIGYEAPVMPWVNPFDVLSSGDAKAGAPNLVDFLEAVTDTRGWEPGENLSVVAHSYGTTVASLALSETPAESFVMLGSAGIDSSIPDVSHLQVDPDNVWASEAAGDGTADLGRLGEHPVNPTGDDYDANVFSSEDRELAGDQLEGSDGHESSPQVTAIIDNKESDAYGYLDAGSVPLRSTAMITLGVTDPLVYYSGGGGGGGGGGGR